MRITNITSSWAVDWEFFDIYLSLWPPLGVFGTPLAFPGPTSASVLTLWGDLGLPLGVLWAPLDPFGVPLGSSNYDLSKFKRFGVFHFCVSRSLVYG